MDEKKQPKRPELPQPKPDVILPNDGRIPDDGMQSLLRMPSPRSDIYREVR